MLKRVEFGSNKDFVNFQVDFCNPPKQSAQVNFTMNFTSSVIDKLMMFVKVFMLSDKNGMKYRKEFIQANIDIDKLFKGTIDSFIGRTLFSGLMKAVNFKFGLPIQKVMQ